MAGTDLHGILHSFCA